MLVPAWRATWTPLPSRVFAAVSCAPAGVKVWSFNPPGGMVTANLSRALQRTVTSVAVGKDVVSRTGTGTFERLLDQVGG